MATMSTRCASCDGTGRLPDLKELGELRKIRTQLGLSLRAMGQRVGKSHVYLGHVETARRGVSWHTYRALLDQYYAERAS